MKVELNFNIDEEKKPRILSWLRLFAAQVLMGEDFPDLYKTVNHY